MPPGVQERWVSRGSAYDYGPREDLKLLPVDSIFRKR